jgi:hypothetical protein
VGAAGVGAIVTGDVIVTNSNDAGAGSFRDAIVQANSNGSIATIAFLPDIGTIQLQSTIAYSGTQDLTINANHATLDGSGAGGAAFVASTNGADLTLVSLAVRNSTAEGITVAVASTATGTVRVSLTDVQISDNAGHGLLVEDQENPLDVTDQDGSAAAVEVSVADSRFLRNGFSVTDRDGIRIDEGGAGSLTFTMTNSISEDNAADGIELDERGVGNVVIDVSLTHLTRNGIFDPDDLDDGFDIDEAGDGSITGQVTQSSANHNYEQGLDFNENDAGDLRVNLTDVEANDNLQEGIEYEEDDDVAGGGDVVTVMERITTNGNGAIEGDGGLKVREKGAGNLDVTLSNIIASQNSEAGIHLRETDAGDARVSIDGAVTNGNSGSTGHGIEVRESSSGSITAATITNVTTSGNTGFGVSVENGTVNATNVKGGANGSGLLGGGASFVVN